jgi:hypothetical protein
MTSVFCFRQPGQIERQTNDTFGDATRTTDVLASACACTEKRPWSISRDVFASANSHVSWTTCKIASRNRHTDKGSIYTSQPKQRSSNPRLWDPCRFLPPHLWHRCTCGSCGPCINYYRCSGTGYLFSAVRRHPKGPEARQKHVAERFVRSKQSRRAKEFVELVRRVAPWKNSEGASYYLIKALKRPRLTHDMRMRQRHDEFASKTAC